MVVNFKASSGMWGQKSTMHWQWADRQLVIGQKTLVMGVLNVTPDSFSDGGRFLDVSQALAQAHKMVAAGADLLDIGGESTRPGSEPISEEEEMNRVLPVIERLIKELPVPISLDTYKARTAQAAIELGVHLINDVGGGRKDPDMPKTVAESTLPVIIMHNPLEASYSYVVSDVMKDLASIIKAYELAGVLPDKIMIDPGIGFGKTVHENLQLVAHLDVLQRLNKPVLLGASRKSFIGKTLNLPVEERLEGSLAAVAWGVMQGVQMVRVHDVKETVHLVKMIEAIQEAGETGQ